MPDLRLDGCSPTPLGSYLKAIGTLRGVASQADPEAVGWWEDDAFHIRCALDRDQLVGFFVDRFRPTPVVSPWNGGSGFHPKDKFARAALDRVRTGASERLSDYRATVAAARAALAEVARDVPEKQRKAQVVGWCRARFPDAALPWLDAALLLIEEGLEYPPLLMSGGNDGRLDFSANFMHRLCDALPELADPRAKGDPGELSAGWLRASLWAERPPALREASIGYFNPGAAGGPNATTGFEGATLVNPWDFVLMIEGVVLFAAAAARRLTNLDDAATAAFPFTVRPSAAGVRQGASERESARAEVWLPLWAEAASLRELEHLCAEGRADWDGHQVRDGLDFVKAIADLGVDRGVSSFMRYGLYQRMGNNHVAVPIGRVAVPPQRRPEVDLVRTIDQGLRRLHGVSGEKAPAALRSAVRRLDRAVYELCLRGGKHAAQEALIALGQAELAFASRDGLADRFRALELDPAWIASCDDGSLEFRLAAALASIHDRDLGPVRANLEPVALAARRLERRASRAQVWTGGSVRRDLAAVFQRRLIDARALGEAEAALRAVRWAPLADIDALLQERVDHVKLGGLTVGFSMVRWDRRKPAQDRPAGQAATLPRAYALLKLCCLPFPVVLDGVERRVSMEPAIPAALAAGRVAGAVRGAVGRLRGSGLPLLRPLLDAPVAGELASQLDAERLAAALLVPISSSAATRLAELVCDRPDKEENR